ncbi:MAG: serine/threonine-protein kinase [Pirellulaceae bacterium]
MTLDGHSKKHAPDGPTVAALIDRVCDEFEEAWRQGKEPSIEDYLGTVPEALRERLFVELLCSDLEMRFNSETTVDTGFYVARFPEREQEIRAVMGRYGKTTPKQRAAGAGGAAGARAGRQVKVDDHEFTGRRYGHYQLLEEVARGGMGVVFKAYDAKLQRTVALKMILDRNLASPEAIERFYAEAETAAGLNHPGIVPIHDVGSQEGQHYYAMGFVEGPVLSEELNRREFSIDESARLVLELSDAVGHAHDHGVVHRDLKPGNILLSAAGQPRITDFGLAKRTDRAGELSVDGQVLGTPGYMAPEQAAGDVERSGPAADIYALGAILYHLLTGHPPFRTALDSLVRVLEQDPIPPRTLNRRVPRDLDVICMKCLSKNPVDRYGAARELADDLQRYLDGELIQARPAGVRRRLQRWGRHRPRLASVWVTMAAFYIHHLISYAIGYPGSRGLFHWQATAATLSVCAYAWVYQKLLMRPRAKRMVLYAWVGTDILVFSLFLFFAVRGARSPLVAIYFCMVASAALSFDRYLVWWVTGGCLLSYGILAFATRWYSPDFETMTYREIMPVMISMLAIGVIQYYVLRCTRPRLTLSAASPTNGRTACVE